jgi:uncharacterized protein YndB with AHSA1/START domain
MLESTMAPTIEQEIVIDAPVDVVWRLLTDPAEVPRWFAQDVDVEPRAGYEGSVTFNENRGLQTIQVAVQAVEPPRAFTYRWQHPEGVAAAEGNSTLVEFTLFPEGDGTRLRVAETGVDRMDGWDAERRAAFADDHNEGWTLLIGRLRDRATGVR